MRSLLWFMILTLLVSVGCQRKSDLAVRYELEKKLAKADARHEELLATGQAISDRDFEEIVAAYAEIAKAVPMPRDSSQVKKASPEKKQVWAIVSLAHTRLGLLYLGRKLYDEAFSSFAKAAHSPATNKLQKNAVYTYMAVAREMEQKYDEAAVLYDSVARGYLEIIVPENPNMDALETPLKAAKIQLRRGNKAGFDSLMENARSYYRLIVDRYPNTLVGNMALGKIAASYLLQERYADAIAAMEVARDRKTGLLPPTLLMMIGDIYLRQLKQYDRAEQTYREFVTNFPNDKNAASCRLGLALALYEQGKYARAREALKDIDNQVGIDDKTLAEAHYLIALSYEKENKWEQARARFNYIEAAFPGSEKAFDAVLYVANYYRSRGEKKLADESFKKAEDYIKRYTDPATSNRATVSRALGCLVRCYTEQENFDAATSTLSQLARDYPDTPEGKLAPLRLADLYENVLKDRKKAAEWLRRFIDMNPDTENKPELVAHLTALQEH